VGLGRMEKEQKDWEARVIIWRFPRVGDSGRELASTHEALGLLSNTRCGADFQSR
jgi:hypothetical protein